MRSGAALSSALRNKIGKLEMIWILPVLFCAIAVAVLLIAEARGQRILIWIAKPIASICFIWLALSLGALQSHYGAAILVGLVFCACGDVLLIGRSRDGESSASHLFLAGMGAFAIGHLAYAVAFSKIWGAFSTPALLASGVLFGVFITVLRWLWPHLGEFRIPVIAYCVIIGVMTCASFFTVAPTGSAPYGLAAAGAMGFAISDIAVARDQFVKPAMVNKLWGLPLYYAAQLALAGSV